MNCVSYRYFNYRGLSEAEFIAIVHYCECKEYSLFSDLIQSDAALSKGMRRFIVDTLNNRLSTKPSNPKKLWNDYNHFCLICDLQRLVKLPLRANKKRPGAGDVSAKVYDPHFTGEAAIKCYQKVHAKLEGNQWLSYADYIIKELGEDDVRRELLISFKIHGKN